MTPISCPAEEGTSSTSWGSQVRVLYRPLGRVVVRRGESNPDYHSCPVTLSKSAFWVHHSEGPAAFYARFIARTAPPMESASLSHGTLLHLWLELGDAFWQAVVAPPESTLTATGSIGKEAKAWAAENAPSSQLVSPKEMAQLRAEIASIQANPAAAELIASDRIADREVSIRWDIDEFPVRCRPDVLTVDGLIVDLKTTKEIGLFKNWWRAVKTFGYHAQDWLYQRGVEAMGIEPKPIHFLVVSTTPPHECLVCTLPPAFTSKGGEAIRSSIADIRLRLDLDCWVPDQHGEVVELPVPAHAF